MPNRSGLCECGCGRRTTIYLGEPRHFITGHNRRVGAYVRLSRYRVSETGCWDWIGSVNEKGYGRAGRSLAHRVSFIEHGGHVPPGFVVDHLCRNRLCVNPDHLEAVPPAENSRRGDMGKKLTAADARAIYADPRRNYIIARQYGVGLSTIGNIKNGVIWRRATGLDDGWTPETAPC